MPHITFRLYLLSIILLILSIPTHSQDYTLPSNFYEANCVFKMDKFDMTIAENYRSAETNVSTYFPAVVGDLDGDGFGEIVIPGGTHNYSEYIFIYDHKAQLKKRITLEGATMDPNHDSVVLADLDNDGKSEIIVTASNGGRLMYIFDYEGNLITSITNPTKFPKTVGVADFNNDGIPEIYVGSRIYNYSNRTLTLLADGRNSIEATVAQDVDGDGIPELISVNSISKVSLNSLTDLSQNSVTKTISCNDITTISQQRERTFALADIDLDGTIDVVTILPVKSPTKRLEVKVWSTNTGDVKYALNIEMSTSVSTSTIRNSWPFIGDADGDGYPDIIFMGGLASKGHTSVYRLEYDKDTRTLKEIARNNKYDDFSSMSTSMSMFDFNNDGKQEIVYRDESKLYIINGETLEAEKYIDDCYSGTGWEYPVVASLTPSGESSIIMCSGEYSTSWVSTGSVRIYGSDIKNGAKPWMPARRIWNQYAFYQNTICDDLKIIAKPAPLNVTLTSKDGKGTTMQPFNGHMFQLGIIKPSTLESVYPIANLGIDINNIAYGFDRIGDHLGINFKVRNTGDAPMDPIIPIEVFKVVGDEQTLIYTDHLDDVFYPGDEVSIDISINSLLQHYPFDHLVVHVARGKYDCDILDNEFTILPEDISGVLYVKKGQTGSGKTWNNAMGELADALQKAKDFNTKYTNSLTQIWVAEGSYEGNFDMQEGVNIYGGFAGEETEIEASRPLDHPTILDAKNNGRPLTQLIDYRIPTEWRGLILQNGNPGQNGGGALLKKGSILSYSIVKNNTTMAEQGGGIYASNSKIINCVIEKNTISNTTKGEGAGIYAVNNSVIINNTIVKNKIEAPTALGGGLYADASTATNNIIYKNAVHVKADNIFSQGGIVSNNLAKNDDSEDPLFTSFDEGDYNLLPISIALNIGDNAAIAGRTIDIAGNDRIYDGLIVDLGAYEYQGIKLVLSKEGYFFVNNTKHGDGGDWNSAANDLADALEAARLLNENVPNTVKQIWVASGTYRGAFEMVEGTDVHGGFAGYETDFNKIDTVTNKTYIDAQGLGRALTQTKDFETPTEWAGIILQNGNETAVDHDVYGGGAYLRKNGTLRYSTIRNSKAVAVSINNKVNAYGGGIYMEEGANFLNSIIDNNIAEVDNRAPAILESGVAQGGGVNNVKNRLAYIIVRNNKTISGGNTDGGAIYSSGNVVNSIVNNNKGKSGIYLSTGQAVINSTIVDNEGEHTIVGSTGSKVQNSIVYNNQASVSDFSQIEYEIHHNLVNKNPNFEANSFKLQISSPARTIGNVSYFPSDLSIDMDGERRYITLKNDVKVIDAGVYQTDIKVISATGLTIEVPFGTKYENLDLKTIILGLLESEYAFECDVDWLEGLYNGMLAGSYTLSGNLSNLSEGVINPDNILGSVVVVVKKNSDSKIGGLFINGEDWTNNIEKEFKIDCSTGYDNIPINISLPYFATIKFEPEIKFEQTGDAISVDFNVVKPGYHLIKAIITSQDGNGSTTYPITLVKYFPFWEIVEQKWNNSFVVNNNKENNGGYEFATYKWYKEGLEIGTKQYYSAGNKRTDLLDENSLYHVEMVDVNGVEYATCKECPVLMSSGIKVYPNPVRVGETITVEMPLADNQSAKVDIYSLSGTSVKQVNLSTKLTTIQAPSTPGLYILKVSLDRGVSESLRIIVQ